MKGKRGGGLPGGGQREIEDEGGAVAEAGAFGGKAAAHLLRGERGAVQAEAVPVLARGKAVRENAGEALGRDADALIGEPHLGKGAGDFARGDGAASS